jgi:2-methylcitrate dehydratase PrpD
MQHAIGIAGSLGAGLMAAQEGAMVKRLHAGRAAQGGMTAALLAKKGFTGISDVVEAGYGGFLSAIARTPNPTRLLDGLGRDWEVAKVGFKMYPNVTSIHAALDAMRDTRVAAADIESIEVGCGHMTFVHTAWDYRPAGVTAAQMNMFYGIAVMALRGDVTARDYTEDGIADPEVLAFIPRIKVFEDPELEAMGAAFRHAARVTVRTTDGRTIKREVLNRRGSPENAVTRAGVERKFAGNLDGILRPEQIEHLEALALSLDTQPNADALVKILSPARS